MERIPLGRRRRLAAKLLLKGVRPTDISRKTGLSFPTIRKYRALLLDSEGPDALAQLKEHGSKSQLDEQALKWLASAVTHSPKHQGIAAPALDYRAGMSGRLPYTPA